MTRLRHEIESDAVALVIGDRRIRVTPTEAKRFAWGLLADLDPDEADKCGGSEIDWSADYRDGELPYRAPTQAMKVLAAVQRGARTCAEIAERTGLRSGIAGPRASMLVDRGYLTRIDGGRRVAAYAITNAGERWLERVRS